MGKIPVWARVLIVTLIVVIIGWKTIASVATEYLWYQDLGYLGVFWKSLEARIAVAVAIFAVTFLFVAANLLSMKSASKAMPGRASLLLASIAGVLAAGFSTGLWMEFQQFVHATAFGKTDPIFGHDVGFYIFRYPFLREVYRGAVWVVGLSAVFVILVYLFSGSLIKFSREQVDEPPMGGRRRRPRRGRLILEQADPRAKLHIGILLAIVFCIVACGYWLAMRGLVYSERGVGIGASYADVHGALPGMRVMFVVSLAAAVLMVISGLPSTRTRVPTVGLMAITVAAMAVLSLLAVNVYPGLVQRFYVTPNEFRAEREYMAYNIDFTRSAFGLDEIVEQEYTVDPSLTRADIDSAKATVDSIRLWDWEPLLATYGQLQGMRLYYSFNDVDVDRYDIDGELVQVMLAARELDVESLPPQAQTWVNRRLKYTHGYGVCASPVNEIGSDGLPTFVLRDIPPRGPEGLELERPEIYFGELTRDWVIVNTKTEEFDYPIGDTNKSTRYAADSGVRIAHLLRRAMLASKFSDIRILLSSDITSNSRVLFDREIGSRVRKIAPFLTYDSDPYVVIADGRLVWIMDGLTTSDAFPFAEKYVGGINYIRNSVKATVDAYTGQTDFYIIDSGDPVAATYSKIFPGLFKTAEEMPQSIREHVRYPEDLFMIQAKMYGMYHMRDPEVFYNKEDLWALPNELYGGAEREVSPYYVRLALPGESDMSFVLFVPFTPSRKNNMVAWLAVNSDMDDFGRMVAYKFGKQRVVFGPMQIEAQIDQDAEISKMLSLWNQSGSTVIRGNLLVYPIGGGLLYVEPLFLAAHASQLPQLKRVVLCDGTKVAIGHDLWSALSGMLSEDDAGEIKGIVPDEDGSADARSVAQEALDLYGQARERLREGDLAGYDSIQREIEELLRSAVAEE
jgi:uncharacterized membrane protein (UPF0182 family)